MEDLIKLVAEKTGIPEEMAKVAVDTVVEYLKGQLPAPLAAQVDNFLSGSGDAVGLDDLVKGLGGLGNSGDDIGLDDIAKGLSGLL